MWRNWDSIFIFFQNKNDPDNVTSDTGDESSYQNLHIQDVTFQEDPTADGMVACKGSRSGHLSLV